MFQQLYGVSVRIRVKVRVMVEAVAPVGLAAVLMDVVNSGVPASVYTSSLPLQTTIILNKRD